ncbi:MAG TPA: DUF6498-containing protein [Candidatus Limnocylindrales bacterium]|nr:DUF6498-containing protein [Candidatus Limnocylindrales bacterium]
MIDRAARLVRATSSTTSIVLLVGFNLVPLIGVLFLRWNIPTILVLYWVENGIVGLLNVPKILLASGETMPEAGSVAAPGLAASRVQGLPRVGVALFFLVHYGLFWLVHGVFVFALPSFAGVGGFTDFRTFDDGSLQFANPAVTYPDIGAVAVGAVGLGISRLASLFFNFVGRREYLRISPARQAFTPYGRLFILHVTIIFGGFVSMMIGSPLGAIVVLVLVKTGADLALHVREHDAIDPLARSPGSGAAPAVTSPPGSA